MRSLVPVLTVLAAIIVAWYLVCIPMNAHQSVTQAERAGFAATPASALDRAAMGGLALALANPGALGTSWSLERAKLPAPHQVAAEFWRSTWVEETEGRHGLVRTCQWPISALLSTCSFSKRGLVYHAGITLGATVLGFAIGGALGVLLAMGIVRFKVMDLSVMPWAIVSQTVPIVALAPMIIVVLYSVGVQGLLPKAVISAYLSFFPVVVGMVKGLRAPDRAQLDLLHTYNATELQGLVKLRLPASMPYLFASLKVAIAASLVGAIVGELPVQKGGLGARMLAGSYYGQTEQIWAALFTAAALAAVLVALIGRMERGILRRMGALP